MTGKIERQLVTCGIFYCRDSAGFSVSASNKLSCNLTGQFFEVGNKNIPLSVMAYGREFYFFLAIFVEILLQNDHN